MLVQDHATNLFSVSSFTDGRRPWSHVPGASAEGDIMFAPVLGYLTLVNYYLHSLTLGVFDFG
jgi:hypothetical protein